MSGNLSPGYNGPTDMTDEDLDACTEFVRSLRKENPEYAEVNSRRKAALSAARKACAASRSKAEEVK